MSKERVQVLLEPEEKLKFQRAARHIHMSLSTWLRHAGLRALEEAENQPPSSPEELHRFFEECDAREEGREPDWEEHLQVVRTSRNPDGNPS